MKCPSCGFEYTYEEGGFEVCSACQFKWKKESDSKKVLDSNGNELNDKDGVIVIKTLKVKGSKDGIKQGTKITNIRLVDDGEHNLEVKIDGIGRISLKSEFVRKT